MSAHDEDRELLAQIDALPREIKPPSDLWPAIAARIAANERRRARMQRARWALTGGLAAALAAAASIAIVASRGAPASSLALRASPRMTLPAATAPRPGEDAYVEATLALESAFDEQRASLPEETVRAVDASISAIHAAIASTRAALRESPDDEALESALFDAYQEEIDALGAVLDAARRT
jgi:hypothetical protein